MANEQVYQQLVSLIRQDDHAGQLARQDTNHDRLVTTEELLAYSRSLQTCESALRELSFIPEGQTELFLQLQEQVQQQYFSFHYGVTPEQNQALTQLQLDMIHAEGYEIEPPPTPQQRYDMLQDKAHSCMLTS